MSVSIDDIRKLKELTGVGLTDAKVALVEAGGDFDKALTAMRKKGITKAEKKGDREAREGIIDGYVHGGRIGVLVEVNCETDFVARTDGFKEFAHEIALQVASMSPEYISEDDIPAAELKRVRDEALASDVLKGKPAEMAEKIVDGQVKKHFADKVLLNQVYIKNEKQTVADFVKENIAKTGENLVIRQFKRIELGVSE
ncbi:MAG TPA: elongation factor Ts [Candidatus Saccharibacteria bacterium]|nr:elongation factor Ts [Candidatus Saccharibacteria bacterium]HRQ97927.1 elongation factor Ts [Candidatus Saccharibacteria bacterium]